MISKTLLRTGAWLLLLCLLMLPVFTGAQSVFDVDSSTTPTINRTAGSTDSAAGVSAEGKTGWVRSDMGSIDKGQLLITQGTVNVRSGPGTNYQVLQQTSRGDRFPIVRTASGWHEIKLSVAPATDGPSAWVRQDMVAKVGKVLIITQDKVNLRAGPSLSHLVVSTSGVGKTFPVVGEQGDWYQISLVSGERLIERSEPRLVEFAQQEFMVAYNIYTRLVKTKGLNHADTQAALREFRSKYGTYSLLAKGSDAVKNVRNSSSKLDQIVVNKANFTATLYSDGKVVRIYPIAYGSNPDGGNKQATGDRRTPEGAFKIVNKAVNPYYAAKNIPGGAPNNPFGTRWMGLNTWGGSIGLHGTSAPSSIGSRASQGCVRMFTPDAEELFELVKVGTPVIITSATSPQN
jgi:lipoprotein-anchoring transpeptidase ErfK/SrfK/SH3-like domain-containing protein